MGEFDDDNVEYDVGGSQSRHGTENESQDDSEIWMMNFESWIEEVLWLFNYLIVGIIIKWDHTILWFYRLSFVI